MRTMHRAKALLDRTASGIEGRLVLAEDTRKGCRIEVLRLHHAEGLHNPVRWPVLWRLIPEDQLYKSKEIAGGQNEKKRSKEPYG